jgi:hypothetical protein
MGAWEMETADQFLASDLPRPRIGLLLHEGMRGGRNESGMDGECISSGV